MVETFDDEKGQLLPSSNKGIAKQQGSHAEQLPSRSSRTGRDAIPPRSYLSATIESTKYILSSILLIFSVSIVMAAIFTKQTVATSQLNISPALACFIFWFLVGWLAMMEGGQGCVVGLEPINRQLYRESHPRTFRITSLLHEGDNLERFIVGRQYLVFLVFTVINLMGSSPVADASVFGLPTWINAIFLYNGIAVILTTIMLGELTSQVNAAQYMLDFVNNYLMLTTSYISMTIEMSGLLHSVYLVQIAIAMASSKPIKTSKEPPRTVLQNIFFWARVILSLGILVFSFAVTWVAIFDNKTNMWRELSPLASMILLFVLLFLVGMMEGIQIALFSVMHRVENDEAGLLSRHSTAQANCQLVFEGSNLQAFLIGRQIFVAACMFVVARIITPVHDPDHDNIFGVSNHFQTLLLNTGLVGAVLTTIVGSLFWRIAASSFPVAFLSNPLIGIILRACLSLEVLGICSISWALGRFNKLLVDYQPDEVHLEGVERQSWEPVTSRDADIDHLFCWCCASKRSHQLVAQA